jgi:glycosyltransferase involved in cell wall biosynthesis
MRTSFRTAISAMRIQRERRNFSEKLRALYRHHRRPFRALIDYGQARLRREIQAQAQLLTLKPDDRPVVFSFVTNPAVNDSRVMKQARSLREAGYRVVLYATKHPAWPNRHLFDGFEVRRFEMFGDPGTPEAEQRSSLETVFGDELDITQSVIAHLRAGAYDSETRPMASRQTYFLKAAIAMSRLIFKERPTIIHSHDLYPLAGAILLAQRTGAKIVFDAHEIETERVPPMPPDLKAYVDRLERRLLERTDRVVVCCDSSADFYANRFAGPRPSVVLNSPAPSNRRSFDLRERCGVDEFTPLIVYTGGVGREARGLHLALEALAMLPAFHLAVLGPRHAKNDQWLLDVAVATSTRARLHLLDPVKHDQVVSAIAGADVGICLIQDVSLSYRFAMPNKLFEMAFAGIPLVVSNLPEMGRFVSENSIGATVDQTDPKSIAAAITAVYAARESYALEPQRLSELTGKYSWPVQAQKLTELYSSLH